MDQSVLQVVIGFGTVTALVSAFQYVKALGVEYVEDEEAFAAIRSTRERLYLLRRRVVAIGRSIPDSSDATDAENRLILLQRMLEEVDQLIDDLLRARNTSRLEFYGRYHSMLERGTITAPTDTAPSDWELTADLLLKEIEAEMGERHAVDAASAGPVSQPGRDASARLLLMPGVTRR